LKQLGKYTLNEEEKIDLQLLIDNIAYNCGSPLIPEEHVFFDKVFIKQKITCRSPVEACFFSCKRIPLLFVFIVEKKMDYWFLKKN